MIAGTFTVDTGFVVVAGFTTVVVFAIAGLVVADVDVVVGFVTATFCVPAVVGFVVVVAVAGFLIAEVVAGLTVAGLVVVDEGFVAVVVGFVT